MNAYILQHYQLELEKLAKQNEPSPIRITKKPEDWEFILQHHPAIKAGDHYDLRLIDPASTIAHSWATKKEWPKPGERIQVFQQPDHSIEYSRHFKGHLNSGRGKTKPNSKGVQPVFKERPEILEVTPNMVRFNLYQGTGAEEFVLARNTKWAKNEKNKHQPWTLLNVTRRKEKLPPEVFSSTTRKAKEEDIDTDLPFLRRQVNGEEASFVIGNKGRIRVYSPKGEEWSHRLEKLYHSPAPSEFKNSILKGDIHGTSTHSARDILSYPVRESRRTQKKQGPLGYTIHDIIKVKNKAILSPEEKEAYFEQLAKLSLVGVPRAVDRERKKQLLSELGTNHRIDIWSTQQ